MNESGPNDEKVKEQAPRQVVAPPPKWLKIFLAVNLTALFGMFIWELSGPVFKSEDDIHMGEQQKAQDLQDALMNNPAPKDVTGTLSGEITYIVDATESNLWAHFDFATGKMFKQEKIASDSLEWDIAFRRAKIVTNGGATGKMGKAAVAVVPAGDFNSVVSAPDGDYVEDKRTENPAETINPAIDKWYIYDWWTHRLKPKDVVYVLRTATGRHVKFKIVDYYCGTASACYTVRYIYQGRESRSFTN